MTVKIKKLFRGCGDIRDHTVRKAINANVPIQLELITPSKEIKVMTLSVDDLRNPKSISKEFKSQFNKDTYKLYSYEWNENKN